MRLTYQADTPGRPAADAVVFLFENQSDLSGRPELAPVRELVESLLKSKSFQPEFLAELPVRLEKGWLLLVGLGQENLLTPARLVEASALAVKMAQARRLTSLDCFLPPVACCPAEDALEHAATGTLLALYRQVEFKSEPGPAPSLTAIRFVGPKLAGAAAALRRAEATAEAVGLARLLGDRPANALYPEAFADEAERLAKPLKLKVKVMDEKTLAKEKMNLILAVGRGSARPPRLVTIEYKGAAAARRPVVLVGKGVTFDSGGLSLKPADGLIGMKTDMAGAATVLAVILAAARLKLPINLVAVMPLAENMPDGDAFRVGDVFASHSGRTVEIANTDAEGRLLLADALALAGEMKPAAIVDVATLTGACAVALGDRCAGLFTDDEALRVDMMSAARDAGEAVWPMPLFNEYDELLKSETADLSSHPGVPRGGAITAALFLRRFVPKDIPWAHLDIAGPGRAGKPRPGTPVGATGFGARTLLRLLARWAG